jgi:hypothetical protein
MPEKTRQLLSLVILPLSHFERDGCYSSADSRVSQLMR